MDSQTAYEFFIITSNAVRAVKGMRGEFVEWDYLTDPREGRVKVVDFRRWLGENEAEISNCLSFAQAAATVIVAERQFERE